MWIELSNEKAVDEFLNSIARFHDSCLSSFSYISGAYVDSNYSMYPLNDRRVLRMLFQRQFPEMTSFELEFYKLKHFCFVPTDDKYSCEIEYAELYIKDGLVFLEFPGLWRSGDREMTVLNSVCAAGCRWRDVT